MGRLFWTTIAAGTLAAGVAMADFNSPEPAAKKEDGYAKAVELVKSEKYGKALPVLERLTKAEPGNADAWNLYGFAARKTGDLTTSETAYAKALSIEPQHKGALEYSGELYLMKSELPKAEAQLATLKTVCPTGCTELSNLEAAIAAFTSGQPLPVAKSNW